MLLDQVKQAAELRQKTASKESVHEGTAALQSH
jgi:hypothetical protein